VGKTVVAGALGECVHVAGVLNFLRLAEKAGWHTVFLGPAVTVEEVLRVARQEKADLVGVSYRLTPETGERLLADFAEAADDLRAAGVRFAVGGTPPVIERARAIGFFDGYFDGGESDEAVLQYLRRETVGAVTEIDFPQTMVERIGWKAPYPLLRHHFGLPTLEATRQGIQEIASAGVLDVISLGIDQDAQSNFFHPERQDPRRTGAGGVPVRSVDDYRSLYAASRIGNFPLLRTYSGTDDFLQLAQMYVETINIAWAAVPLFWFNRMDGRGPWDLEGSIREHQRLMAWYGRREIPVELNEPHHWAMRDAPDVVSVVAAFLSAYNAKAFGVKDYVAQFMFNSPAGISDRADLAKMLAVLDLIEPLAREAPRFRIWRQTRTGLLSYPLDLAAARAHLATSIYVQMSLSPHIVHVVGHTEAHHAAAAADVIESSVMARRSIDNALRGAPDMHLDPIVRERRGELVREAQVTLAAIHDIGSGTDGDPLTDPMVLSRAVTVGLLDAAQLRGNAFARGEVVTHVDERGAYLAVDPKTGVPLSETERIARLTI
jgi:methylmalonyl-CoA mutase cobalamin-binding subunit